jgi:hypothetical protein
MIYLLLLLLLILEVVAMVVVTVILCYTVGLVGCTMVQILKVIVSASDTICKIAPTHHAYICMQPELLGWCA